MLAVVPWLPSSILNMDLNETQWYKDLYYGVGDIIGSWLMIKTFFTQNLSIIT